MRRLTLVLLVILLASHARPAGKFSLTIDNIMRGPQLFGYEPAEVRWSGDGERIYFQWKQASDPRIKAPDTYVVGRDGSGLRKLSDAEAETNPHFTHDEKRVTFTRSNNLFVMALDSGAIEEMTDIRPAGSPPTPDEEKGTASQEALKKEEKDLLEVVRERAEEREEQEAKRRREHPRKPFVLQAGQTVASLQLTPDQKYVIATIREPATGAKRTIVPSLVTESGYTEDIPSYEKVGDKQSLARLAILSVETGEVKWVDHGQRAAVQSADAKTPVDREVRLSEPLWS